MNRLAGGVFQSQGSGKQIICAEPKLLHHSQAARQRLFSADAAVRSGESEIAVPLQRFAADQGERGRQRFGIECRDLLGRRAVLDAASDRLRIILKFNELQPAAVRGERATDVVVLYHDQFFGRVRLDERACLDAGRRDARDDRRRMCTGGNRVHRAGDRICPLRNRLWRIKPVHQRIPDHQEDERDDEDDDRFAVHWAEFSGCGCNPCRGRDASFPFANRQPANLAIGNLKFGVWNFSLARGRGHTRPTGGSDRFAAPPANFRAASRVAESLRGRIASRSA